MAVVEAESELLRAAGPQADRPARPRRRRWLPALGGTLRPAWAGALACGVLAVGVVGGVLASGGSDGPATRTVAAYAQGTAHAKLAVRGDRASLELAGMPVLSKGRVYQVWLDHGDGRKLPSRTVFNVRPGGQAKVDIDESVAGVKKILVTAEDSSGALTPSEQPVVTAALS